MALFQSSEWMSVQGDSEGLADEDGKPHGYGQQRRGPRELLGDPGNPVLERLRTRADEDGVAPHGDDGPDEEHAEERGPGDARREGERRQDHHERVRLQAVDDPGGERGEVELLLAALQRLHGRMVAVAAGVVQRDARRGHLAGLADAERADDEQRERDDAGAPGADDLDVEAVPEAEEEQAEEDLAGVVAAAPERAHRRALHPGPPDGQRRQRGQVVRPRQRVQAPRQETRPRAAQQLRLEQRRRARRLSGRVEVRQRRRRPGWLDQRQDGRQEQSDSCSRSHLLERTARQTCEHHRKNA